MDRNTIIGFLLIFAIILVWQRIVAPTPEEIERQQARLDSLRRIEQLKADSLARLTAAPADSLAAPVAVDSARQTRLAGLYGPFAHALDGEEQFEVLENEEMRVLFSNKGGRIMEVELKNYFKVQLDSNHQEHKLPLKLLEDSKNRFEYLLPIAQAPNGTVPTGELFFQTQREGNRITFTLQGSDGSRFEQQYVLGKDFALDYRLNWQGLNRLAPPGTDRLRLHWTNYLDKLEQNTKYERNYSTVYFKVADDDPDYCSCTSDDEENLESTPLDWVAHSNQFFASVLLAKEANFRGGRFRTEVLDEEAEDLKKLQSDIYLPFEGEGYAMEWYIGPKKFENLLAYDALLEDIIPFGRSIFGTINRWVIRPLFNFLLSFIGSKGIAILVLTLIVKLLLFPLTYKMLYSQSKMAALKPRLASLKDKFKDDPQKMQMETMKIYREFGVNPLGGCLPMILQMPIWFALYRFFPASIQFRQADFLWATDLSSYDAAFWLPFNIPFYGEHVSLFTLLWALSTVAYTHYNMKHMDMSAMGNPMMKYMQYFMPVMFLFFFNNFASGLTCYLLFSNVTNIAQTLITKNYIIDQEKILQELEAYKKKPKKKGGFQARLEAALKEQQRRMAEEEAARKRARKKK